KKTELITIFFIFIVLVIVFKSPIVPIISLLTVGVSFITSFSIVTILVEKFNFPFSNFTQVLMVIVLFCFGSDFYLLLLYIFIVLVIVFKSPIVPIISLLTVGVSFITSFSLVTNLVEKFNFPFSNFTQVFMVIVLFGIGTDYNILLYDKFKENLSKGMSNHEA